MALKNKTAIKEFVLLGLSNDPTIQIILFIIFCYIYCGILLANTLIILVTVMASKLQTPMYFFLCNLSLVDLSASSSTVPRMLRDLSAATKTILFAECMAQLYICFSVGATECILLAVMAYDRYVAICYPLHYTQMNTRAACIKMAAGAWSCGLLSAAFCLVCAMNLNFCGLNMIRNFLCELPEILALACGYVATAKSAIFGICAKSVIFGICALLQIVSLCFISITYTIIVRAIFKISSSAGRSKMFSTCTSHIMVVTLLFGPGMANYLQLTPESSHDKNKYLVIFYVVVTPLLNPLIYTLRNKEFNCALKILFS